MEWWTADMTEFATRLVLALVAVLFGAWKTGLFRLAHEWAAGLKDERIAGLADKLVLAAEQQFGGGAGETKLNWALEQSWIKKLGVDREDIEAAVRIMNSATSEATTAPDPTTTAELATAKSQIAALEAQLAALATPLKAITGSVTTTGEPTGDCIPDLAESFGFGGVDGGGGSH